MWLQTFCYNKTGNTQHKYCNSVVRRQISQMRLLRFSSKSDAVSYKTWPWPSDFHSKAYCLTLHLLATNNWNNPEGKNAEELVVIFFSFSHKILNRHSLTLTHIFYVRPVCSIHPSIYLFLFYFLFIKGRLSGGPKPVWSWFFKPSPLSFPSLSGDQVVAFVPRESVPIVTEGRALPHSLDPSVCPAPSIWQGLLTTFSSGTWDFTEVKLMYSKREIYLNVSLLSWKSFKIIDERFFSVTRIGISIVLWD